jgi:hypothetical protein
MLWVGYYSPLNVRADHVRYRGRIAGRFDDDYVVRRHIAAKAFNRSRRMSIRPSRLIPNRRTLQETTRSTRSRRSVSASATRQYARSPNATVNKALNNILIERPAQQVSKPDIFKRLRSINRGPKDP